MFRGSQSSHEYLSFREIHYLSRRSSGLRDGCIPDPGHPARGGTDAAEANHRRYEAAARAFGEAAWLEEWTCGFAALKGRAFPVIDLRAKLGIEIGSTGRQPCIVVVEVASRMGPQLGGFVADRLSEVVMARERDFSRGKLRGAGRPRQVLDPDVLFSE